MTITKDVQPVTSTPTRTHTLCKRVRFIRAIETRFIAGATQMVMTARPGHDGVTSIEIRDGFCWLNGQVGTPINNVEFVDV